MTITLKVSENTKQKMIEYFQDKKREKTPAYAIFQADEEDTVVTLYESGKAVFQGVSADVDANMWKEMEKHLNPLTKIDIKTCETQSKLEKPKQKYIGNIIGSDEVGTGDYFGPVVVTATYVPQEKVSFLETLGVCDSKKLTDQKILEIVPKIIKVIPYHSMILNNLEYNQKYNENFNMNKIKAILHNRVLCELESNYSYDYIIVDQFTPEYTYYQYLKESSRVCTDITFLTKAEDQCFAVACASLISRYIFIKEFEKMERKIGMPLVKGAGEKVDEIGVILARKYGIEKLKEWVKWNFKNTQKIQDKLNQD